MGKTYRVFEVDSDSGLATPVDNPKLNSGDVVLVGSVKELGQKVEPNPQTQSDDNEQS